MHARDEFTQRVKVVLFMRVAGFCSNLLCRPPTSGPGDDPDEVTNIGVAAHITAAAPGGPRYDVLLTEEERRSVTNGIWLCQSCSKLIDSDQARFTVSVLKEWKTDAETRALAFIRGAPGPSQLPKRLIDGLLAELDEFRLKMAQTSYLLRARVVEITHEFLLWIRNIMHSYRGPHVAPYIQEHIERQCQLDDQQLYQLHRSRFDPNKGLSLKKFQLPLLEANMDRLSDLPRDFQQAVLDMKSDLDIFNQEVDYSMSMHQKTFDPAIFGANRDAIILNLFSSYRNLASRAKDIADEITTILQKHPIPPASPLP